MRTVLLLLALASGFGLAGCLISVSPVDLHAVETPRQAEASRSGGRLEDRAGP